MNCHRNYHRNQHDMPKHDVNEPQSVHAYKTYVLAQRFAGDLLHVRKRTGSILCTVS